MILKSRRFSMPVLRKRARKTLKKKYGKLRKLSTLDKVWGDWVEYAIIRPLLTYGKVQIDEHFSIEIVGRKVEDVPVVYNLLSKGRAITKKGRFIEPELLGRNRTGILYKIVVTDTNYKKGQLIFESDRDLAKRVREHLENTQTYYRIAT